MKTLFKIFIFLIVFGTARGQSPVPVSFPIIKTNQWYEVGWMKGDSGLITSSRDTNFIPRYPFSIIGWQHNGVDTSLWFNSGSGFKRIASGADIFGPGTGMQTQSGNLLGIAPSGVTAGVYSMPSYQVNLQGQIIKSGQGLLNQLGSGTSNFFTSTRIVGGLTITDFNNRTWHDTLFTSFHVLADGSIIMLLDTAGLHSAIGGGGPGGGVWGSITGTLSAQTDLQTALNGKLSTSLTSAGIYVGNGSNVATAVAPTGAWTINNAGVSALTANSVVTSNITNNNVTYGKIQQVNAARLTGNAGGVAANMSEIPVTDGIKFSGGNLVADTAFIYNNARIDTIRTVNQGSGIGVIYGNGTDTIFGKKLNINNGLTGSTQNDSSNLIQLGGNIIQSTTLDLQGAYQLVIGNAAPGSGTGFKVNFGSDAGWDMFTKDSATGFWSRIPKGTPGQSLQMLSTGGIGWAAQAGGSGSPAGSNTQVQFNNSGAFGGATWLRYNNSNGNIYAMNDTIMQNKWVIRGDTLGNPFHIEMIRTSSSNVELFRGTIGTDGSTEMNEGVNFDYTTGSHKPFDQTKNSYWTFLGYTNGWGLQYCKSGHASLEGFWQTIFQMTPVSNYATGEAVNYGSKLNFQIASMIDSDYVSPPLVMQERHRVFSFDSAYALRLPSVNTANLPANQAGLITYRPDSTGFFGNTGSGWVRLSGSGSGGTDSSVLGSNGLFRTVSGSVITIKLGDSLTQNSTIDNTSNNYNLYFARKGVNLMEVKGIGLVNIPAASFLTIGDSTNDNTLDRFQIKILGANTRFRMSNIDNNTDGNYLFANKQRVLSYSLTNGDVIFGINANTIARLEITANSSAPGGFSSADMIYYGQNTSSGTIAERWRVTSDGAQLWRGTFAAPSGGLPILVKGTDSTVYQIAQSSLTGVPNIYNANGTVGANRTVTLGTNNLIFDATGGGLFQVKTTTASAAGLSMSSNGSVGSVAMNGSTMQVVTGAGPKWQLDVNGQVMISGTMNPNNRKLYVDGSIGATKDSINTITSNGGNFILTIDTANSGQFKKILPANIGGLNAAPLYSVVTADPTNWTAAISTMTELPDLTSASSSTVTLPSAGSNTGKFVILWNKNASGSNLWTFASAVTVPAGTTTSAIANGTMVTLISDGSVWVVTNIQ